MKSTSHVPEKFCEMAPNDGLLCRRVEQSLSASGYPHLQTISVNSDGGVVTLAGTVTRYYDMQVAVAAAMRVPGVSRLENHILVMI